MQHYIDSGALSEADVAPEEARTVGDIHAAWISTESRDAFTLVIQVADIPDENGFSSPLAELWAHFTIGGQAYHASSVLSLAEGSDKITSRQELWRDQSSLGEIAGAVQPEDNQVVFRIAKADVGGPSVGDELTRFYVTSHLPNQGLVLDYAPHAQGLTPDDHIDPLNPTLGPSLSFGDTYAFGQFEGAVPSAIQLVATPNSLELASGDQGVVSITVANDADQADTVELTVGDVPDDWSARLDDSRVTLDPGQAKILRLYVTAPSDAAGQDLLTLHATSEPLGADRALAISVSATPPAPSPQDPGSPSGDGDSTGAAGQDGSAGADGSSNAASGDDQDAAGSEQDGDGQAGEENDAPGPGVLLILGAVGLMALARARVEEG